MLEDAYGLLNRKFASSDLCLGELQDEDNIYVDVVSAFPDAPEGVGGLIFGVRRGEEDAQVAAAGAWIPGQAHLYLFTVSQRKGRSPK